MQHLDESPENYTATGSKKTIPKGYILYGFIYTASLKWQTYREQSSFQGLEEGRVGGK